MAASLLLLVLGCDSALGHEAGAIAPERPASEPARGMVYRGLTPAPDHSPCEGGFEVEAKGPIVCTHGPDPAPPGVDVRKPRSVAELRADTFGAAKPAVPRTVAAPAAPGALVPCVGDGSSGNRVQVIYARAADRPDRFTELRSLIGTWATQASSVFDDSAAQGGGSRLIRFVTQPSPDCELSIDSVTLSSSADDSFGNTIDELQAAGYNRSDRKYMVFMDANVLCGIGEIMPDDQPGASNWNNGRPGVPGSIGRTDAGCWGELNERISVEAHELVHNLGGVQLSAPNSSGGWHCVDEYDTECYSDEPFYPPMQFICPSSEERLLDCNDDDYFSADPAPGSYLATHWNVANSLFLTPEGGPPVPPNDAFAAAQTLTGSEAVRLGDSNAGATKEGGEPAHAGNGGGASVWYSWTAPASGPVAIDTAQSDFDTLLAVYTGTSVGSLAEVTSNDDVVPGSDLSSRLNFEATAGQTYRIAVDGFGGGSGTFRLQLVASAPPPPNDAFASAQPLLGSDLVREGDTNSKATKEGGEPAHAGNGGGASVWYSWAAPANGPVAIETVGSDFDTLLGVYVGDGIGSLTEIAANDDVVPGSDQSSKVEFAGAAGQTYRIAVDGFNGGGDAATGEVRLRLLGTEPAPPNDAFVSAQPLFGSSPSREGDTNRKATKEGGEPAHAGNGGGASVWYSWTAPANGPVVIETAGSDFDTTLAAYLGSSVGSLFPVASNDDVSGLRTSRIGFDAAAGTTYRIAVDGYNGSEAAATGALNLFLVQGETGPANDAFASPLPLFGSDVARNGDTNLTATKEPEEPAHAGNPGGASVWYSWTAPFNGPAVAETAGSSFDTLLGVYVGDGIGALSVVGSNDDAGDITSRVAFTAAIGQTYRLAVDGFNSGGGASRGILNVRVRPDSATEPAIVPLVAPLVLQRVSLPPQTRILGGPRGRVRSRRATFRFAADQPATFACRLDRRPWSACVSPQRYRRLALGAHVFQVSARDSSGGADSSPAVRTFRIVR